MRYGSRSEFPSIYEMEDSGEGFEGVRRYNDDATEFCMNRNLLKTILTTALLTLAYSLACNGQNNQSPVFLPPGAHEKPASTNLIRFNLDFAGGTPQQLVDAISKASGRPLNAIIAPEKANLTIPPLKMSDVDVVDLFQALEVATTRYFSIPPNRFTGDT